ncbi:MAG TPA: aminopeptidase [Spirochaetia bacterium]|nr:aminopeptidase [Spirochaetia bacterium]
MTDAETGKYVELLLWCLGGVNGQNVRIRAEVVHRDFVVRLAEAAYKEGARTVDLDFAEPLLLRARLKHARSEYLGVLPEYRRAQQIEYARADWSNITIVGSNEPDSLDGIDSSRMAAFYRSHREVHRPLLEAMTHSRKPWVMALLPTPAIAAKALPDVDPRSAFERYEQAFVEVLSLDSPDPISVWRERIAETAARSERYNQLGIVRLRFTGLGTDLSVGLLEGSRWSIAQDLIPDGRMVVVNIPSFEIYTTPDFRRTNGTVTATRPFESTSVSGQTISGAWFEFRDGAVVDFGAESGGEVLKEVLNIDRQARFLGEVALVDLSSPVARTNLNFHEVLFDENAASHIALGAGFPPLVRGCEDLPDPQLLEVGVNASLVHDDIMIGSAEVDVVATTRQGREVELMRQGEFVY